VALLNAHRVTAVAATKPARSRVELSARRSWFDIRTNEKVHHGHDPQVIRRRDAVQNTIYNQPRRWRPSPSHRNDSNLAERYAVESALFAESREARGFPAPISDFGGFEPPVEKWWHGSVVAAWERTNSRRRPDWSARTLAVGIASERTAERNRLAPV